MPKRNEVVKLEKWLSKVNFQLKQVTKLITHSVCFACSATHDLVMSVALSVRSFWNVRLSFSDSMETTGAL